MTREKYDNHKHSILSSLAQAHRHMGESSTLTSRDHSEIAHDVCNAVDVLEEFFEELESINTQGDLT